MTMNKYIAVYALLGAAALRPLCARPQESPDRELQSAAAGEIRQDDVQDLQQYDDEVAKWLADTPNDQYGKQSPLYPKLQAWSDSLHRLALSHKQADAFSMIPLMVDVFTGGKTEGAAEELKEVKGRMNDCGFPLIMAAGAYIKQHNGEVNPATLSNFVKLFSVPGFDMEPDWENAAMPIDAAGLMVINPTVVVNQLKSEPWQRAQEFIGNRTPAQFFERYTANGDGLAVLKAKYAAQEAAVSAKFKQLVVWEWWKEQGRAH